MAFENVASTSSASMNQEEDAERIEMNTSQYPNYQSNQMHGGVPTSAESSNTYGAVGAEVGEEDDLNDNLEEKMDKDVGYRKFLYNNSEQFKSICGGECSPFLSFLGSEQGKHYFVIYLKCVFGTVCL